MTDSVAGFVVTRSRGVDTAAMETLVEGVVQPSVYIKQEIQVGLSCACACACLCRVCLWRVFAACDRQHVLLFVCVRVQTGWFAAGC